MNLQRKHDISPRLHGMQDVGDKSILLEGLAVANESTIFPKFSPTPDKLRGSGRRGRNKHFASLPQRQTWSSIVHEIP